MPDMTTATADTVSARVARGARFLDENKPGWAALIDLDWLAMEKCSRCILGQLHGDYFDALETLSHDGKEDEWGSDHGFTLSNKALTISSQVEIDLAFKALADFWRAEIRARS